MNKPHAQKQFFLFWLISSVLITLAGCKYSCQHEKPADQATATTKTIYSFLGAPGSGKGTLSELCVKDLGYLTVSTGNLCREEIALGTEKGKIIAAATKGAGLVSDELITQMVEAWLAKQTGEHPIILDGYPRTKKQAHMFAELLKTKFPTYQLHPIYLQVDDYEEIVQRLSNRLVCENKQCQAVYNRALLKDPNTLTCQKCGGKLIQRKDDTPETIRERLKIFDQNNGEIMAFYTQAGIPITTVNVSKKTPEQIFENFKQLVVA